MTVALVCNLEANVLGRCSATAAGTHSHTNIVARWWSNSGREQREEWAALLSAGVYTPNNRCRPEAPLTSLPKLTPVKNVEEDRRVGEGEKGRTTQEKKNHKRQK